MASILFSQGPIERPQSTRQLIIVEALKRRLLTAGFQEVWKKKKKRSVNAHKPSRHMMLS